MDLSVFYAIHSIAGVSPALDAVILFFAKWHLYVVLGVFAYVGWSNYHRTASIYPYITALLAGVIARGGLTELIRYFYHHDRPFVALNISHLLTDDAYSFPSGHTIFLFALGAATYFFNKKLAYFIFASGLVIGLARVAAGVHYPSDILGGAVLGIFVGVCVYQLGRNFFAEGK